MVQAREVEAEVVVEKGIQDALLVELVQAEWELAQTAQQPVDVVAANWWVQVALELGDAVAVPEDGQAEQAEQLRLAMIFGVRQMVFEAVAQTEKLHRLYCMFHFVQSCVGGL